MMMDMVGNHLQQKEKGSTKGALLKTLEWTLNPTRLQRVYDTLKASRVVQALPTPAK
jgi:hypothetical protein